jgi:hypothetical protein
LQETAPKCLHFVFPPQIAQDNIGFDKIFLLLIPENGEIDSDEDGVDGEISRDSPDDSSRYTISFPKK